MLKRLILFLVLLLIAATPAMPVPLIIKGLAELDVAHGMADRSALGVTQYYHWGEGCGAAAGCLNMNRNWMLPQATCYPTLLVGNEPTNPEPAGHPIAASVAASVTLGIEAACPATRLIVANIHLNNGGSGSLDWIRDYLAAYALKAGHAFTQTLGVHCYSSGGQWCLDKIREATTLYSGPVWVTEFGIYNPEHLTIFLNGIGLMKQIERVYIWTNRDTSDPYHWFDLVDSAGNLTALGTIWANWKPPTISKIWLPKMNDRLSQGYP